MAKNIWKGFDKQGEKISSQPFAITGANLRQNSERKSLEPLSSESEDAREKPQQSVAVRNSRSSGSVKT